MWEGGPGLPSMRWKVSPILVDCEKMCTFLTCRREFNNSDEKIVQ